MAILGTHGERRRIVMGHPFDNNNVGGRFGHYHPKPVPNTPMRPPFTSLSFMMQGRNFIFGPGENNSPPPPQASPNSDEGAGMMMHFGQKPFGVGVGGNGRPFTFRDHNKANDGRYGKCVCKPGYSVTKEGHCLPSFGANCFPSRRNATQKVKDLCNPDAYLECLGGTDFSGFRCQCRNPLSEKWNSETNQCVVMAGKRCRSYTPSSAYPKCEEGSECTNGICQCKSGTSLTPYAQCKLDYNQPCSPGECNEFAGLTCHGKTETCLCLDSYLNYDNKTKTCVAQGGSPCGPVIEQYSHFPSPHRSRIDPPLQPQSVFINCERGKRCVEAEGKLAPATTTKYHDNRQVSYTCEDK